MDTHAIALEVDREIGRLQQIRALLVGSTFTYANQLTGATTDIPPRKHNMSAEGRARIVAAQKKRWAAQKNRAKRVA